MLSIQKKIKNAIYIFIDKSTHIDVADATQFIAKKLGLKDRMLQYAHIEIRNFLNEEKYKIVPYSERILFLPQCLRNSKKCKAKLGEEGYECKNCGKCKICELKKLAEKLGYAHVFIVPGGSMVQQLIQKYSPKAVLGIGCYEEVLMAMDKLTGTNVAAQGVILLRSGCKDTDVNIDEAKEKLLLFEKNSDNKKSNRNSRK